MEKAGKLRKEFFLFFANGLLVSVAWISALYSYLQLPERMPLWSYFLSQSILTTKKSPTFFIFPLSQTLAVVLLWQLFKKNDSKKLPAEKELAKEVEGLALIFINLIFIHIQTRFVLVAHQKATGINRYYLGLVLANILAIMLYYHIRLKLLERGKGDSSPRGRQISWGKSGRRNSDLEPGGPQEKKDVEAMEIPIDGILDLHTYQASEVKDLLPEYLRACLQKGIFVVKIIHGKGTGSLLRTVHSIFRKMPEVDSFKLAEQEEGGWGATIVRLKMR